ncbi:unnamed protein product [Protopolystoma xenopodis]|uniref:Uncharacterized protein n=1 Tax=Protopolystoma xenopodis TaxID=117903 RepID=A0A3S5C5N3_9PLAT|nr:unnamed protein product [Protopolystoma xenopodis]
MDLSRWPFFGGSDSNDENFCCPDLYAAVPLSRRHSRKSMSHFKCAILPATDGLEPTGSFSPPVKGVGVSQRNVLLHRPAPRQCIWGEGNLLFEGGLASRSPRTCPSRAVLFAAALHLSLGLMTSFRRPLQKPRLEAIRPTGKPCHDSEPFGRTNRKNQHIDVAPESLKASGKLHHGQTLLLLFLVQEAPVCFFKQLPKGMDAVMKADFLRVP